MRVLVCGPRELSPANEAIVRKTLLSTLAKHTGELARFLQVIHGNASAVDKLAARLAHEQGWGVFAVLANRDKHGKDAAAKRNAELVGMKPDVVFVFTGYDCPDALDIAAKARQKKCKIVLTRL